MKKYYFLSGLPRSGNTLLSSILNQNKNITVTPNSPLVGYLYGFSTCDDVTKSVLNNFDAQKSIDNVASNIIPNYYSHYQSKYIIDRGPWATPVNFEILKKYAPNEIKVIVLVRDILEIIASFIKWSRENPNNFIDKNFSSIEEQCDYLMNPNGMISLGLMSCYNLSSPDNKKYAHFINYDSLVKNTKEEIDNLYKFLGIEKYNHNLQKINQLTVNGITYNDSKLGNNLHTIKENGIYKSNYNVKKYLPDSVIEKYKIYNCF